MLNSLKKSLAEIGNEADILQDKDKELSRPNAIEQAIEIVRKRGKDANNS